MEKRDKRISKRLDELDNGAIVTILQRWNLEEFSDFVKEKHLDGRKLMEVTEGLVKLWRPRANAKKFISFIDDLKLNPEKYFDETPKISSLKEEVKNEIKNIDFENFEDAVSSFEIIHSIDIEEEITNNSEIIEIDNAVPSKEYIESLTQDNELMYSSIESQYQTVKPKKNKEGNKDMKEIKEEVMETKDTSTLSTVEELLKKIVPAKSFLYRHNPKKNDKTPSYLPMDGGGPKKSLKFFRLNSYEYPFFDLRSKFSRNESNDRGYYAMKRNSIFYLKPKRPEARTKYKSLPTPDEGTPKYAEDHLYEDLNYNEMVTNKVVDRRNSLSNQVVRPCIVKIQELFHSFRMPFFKRNEEKEEVKEVEEKEVNASIYENAEIANMYDSVHVNQDYANTTENLKKIQVEEYLEPVHVNKDYCDVSYKQKDDSILGYIMSIFESRFGIRRETNDANQSEVSDNESNKISQEVKWEWPKSNMADRPLPVPVENEAYYMNIDRTEAENLLKGQPDGTFILRPSSQPNHAYTLSVSCSNAVHNVGIRRRPDGRLSLGFARKGERSFASITALLQHHKKRRLLLVAGGGVIGATTLNEAPQYYQSPSSLPVLSACENP